MKSNQLKKLLKHIILEVNSQVREGHDYDNFDDPSNVANAIYSGLYKAPDLGDIDKTDGGQVYIVMLHSPSGPRHLIKRTPNGRWFYSDSTGYGRKWEPADAHIAAKKQDRAEYARTGKPVRENIWNGLRNWSNKKLINSLGGEEKVKRVAQKYIDAGYEEGESFNKAIEELMEKSKDPNIQEMIANKDVAPDVFGAVNVENVGTDYERLQKQGISSDLHSGRCPVCGKGGYKHKKESNLNYCSNGHAWNDKGSILINTDNGSIEESDKKKKRVCYHCKQPSPCKCDKYDDEHRDASDPESPKFDKKRFGTNSRRNPETGKLEFEEGLFDDGAVKKKAKELFGKVKKISKISHPESNSQYFRITLSDPDSHHTIRKDKAGKLSLGREEGGKLRFDQVEEETGTGAVAGYSTPFAFKSTHKHKKKKHVKEGNALTKVKGSGLTNEKVNPDGTYSDDMEDGRRSNRIAGMTETNDSPSKMKQDLDEMTSSGAAGGQPGGTIQVPAWGTKNKLGSPKGIKGSEKLGYKVVRSITN